MRVNTRSVRGRRRLRFQTLEDILADAERLAAAPHRTLGNWSLGQVLAHLSTLMNQSLDGFAFRFPVSLRMLARPMRGRLLRHGFPVGVQLRGSAMPVLTPQAGLTTEQGLAMLRASVARLRTEPQRHPSPLLGKLTAEEWERLHCRHAELHLSFVTPAQEAPDGPLRTSAA